MSDQILLEGIQIGKLSPELYPDCPVSPYKGIVEASTSIGPVEIPPGSEFVQPDPREQGPWTDTSYSRDMAVKDVLKLEDRKQKDDSELVKYRSRDFGCIYSTHSGYLSSVAGDRECVKATVNRIVDKLRAHSASFDTIAVCGLSGMLVGPTVAYLLDKELAVVRKANDGHHSSVKVEGPHETPKGYVFLDDLISSGETFRNVLRGMEAVYPDSRLVGVACYDSIPTCGYLMDEHDLAVHYALDWRDVFKVHAASW